MRAAARVISVPSRSRARRRGAAASASVKCSSGGPDPRRVVPQRCDRSPAVPEPAQNLQQQRFKDQSHKKSRPENPFSSCLVRVPQFCQPASSAAQVVKIAKQTTLQHKKHHANRSNRSLSRARRSSNLAGSGISTRSRSPGTQGWSSSRYRAQRKSPRRRNCIAAAPPPS